MGSTINSYEDCTQNFSRQTVFLQDTVSGHTLSSNLRHLCLALKAMVQFD